ncbi:hypothetical protein EW146_g10502, partial [Bondarzewia mesenterica]
MEEPFALRDLGLTRAAGVRFSAHSSLIVHKMSAFLPLLENPDDELEAVLSRIGPIILPALPSLIDPASNQTYLDRYILVDHDTSIDLNGIISCLDRGAEKIIVPLAWAPELIGVIPSDRLLLLLDVANASAVSDKVRSGVSGVLLKSSTLELDLISSISRFFAGSSIFVLPAAYGPLSPSTIRGLLDVGATL